MTGVPNGSAAGAAGGSGASTPPKRRVLLLCNAKSGLGFDLAELERDIAGLAHLSLDIVMPDPSDFAALSAMAEREVAAEAVDAVIVQGGDGMVQFGVGLVAGTRVPLGVVPAGSGNDFARAAGLTRGQPRRVLRALLTKLEHPRAATQSVDALRVVVDGRERWVANSVNMGFDALVNIRANALSRLRGSFRYLVALVQESRSFVPISYELRLDDGETEQVDAVLICVLNGTSIGGGIPAVPDADLADGFLDVVVVDAMPRWGLYLLFPAIMARLHRFVPQLRSLRARQVDVRVGEGAPIYADGEPLDEGEGGESRAVKVELVPGAWRLIR